MWHRNIPRKLHFIATSSSGHLPRYDVRQYVMPCRYLKCERSLSSDVVSLYQQKFKHQYKFALQMINSVIFF
jgi:hypothetical protein